MFYRPNSSRIAINLYIYCAVVMPRLHTKSTWELQGLRSLRSKQIMLKISMTFQNVSVGHEEQKRTAEKPINRLTDITRWTPSRVLCCCRFIAAAQECPFLSKCLIMQDISSILEMKIRDKSVSSRAQKEANTWQRRNTRRDSEHFICSVKSFMVLRNSLSHRQ